MSDTPKSFAGGCRCGAVRYEAEAPLFMGLCFCSDCRRTSGSGFVPVIGFEAATIRIEGETRLLRAVALGGGEAVRNACEACGSIIFGGVRGVDGQHNVYAGTLDDPNLFEPAFAIFCRERPAWVPMPEGLTCFETMPGM